MTAQLSHLESKAKIKEKLYAKDAYRIEKLKNDCIRMREEICQLKRENDYYSMQRNEKELNSKIDSNMIDLK